MREIDINVRNLKDKFEQGLESIIYYYFDPEHYSEVVLYKRFRSIEYIREYNSDISYDMLENKYSKICMIPSSCLKDEVKLIDIGLEKGKFSGYTMRKSSLTPIKAAWKKIDDKNNFKLVYYKLDDKEVGLDGKPKYIEMTFADKIKYLKLLREKIEILNEKDIYIGDFNYENFLVSGKLDKMVLCDLDNLKIGELDFDNKTASVKKYEETCMEKNNVNSNKEGLDSYCFNIFTLSILLDQANFTTLRNIESIELPKEIASFENNEIMESIKHLDKSYKPRFLIDKFR